MSNTIIARSVLLIACFGLPQVVEGQGSQRLLAVEKAFDSQQAQDKRPIGGQPVLLKENPWQVAIVAARIPSNVAAQFCGGSIIGARWVLTAAHCVDGGTQPKQIAILVGTESLASGGARVPVTRIIVHQAWNPKSQDSDMALIEVSADLGGTAIPGDTAAAEHPDTLPIRVTGWGRTSMNSSAGTTVLQGINVPYVSRSTCNRPLSYGGDITTNMICAGFAVGGVDSCQGDSGGPASAVITNNARLVGIVSWGHGCALPNKFGVYTRVASFASWVAQNTGGAVKW